MLNLLQFFEAMWSIYTIAASVMSPLVNRIGGMVAGLGVELNRFALSSRGVCRVGRSQPCKAEHVRYSDKSMLV